MTPQLAEPLSGSAVGRFALSTVCEYTVGGAVSVVADHCGDPGSAGDREDPDASGVAGQGATAGASPWVAAASGLTVTQALRPSGAAPRGRGVRLRPRVSGADGSGLVIRGNPHTMPMTEAFPLRRQRSTDRSRLQGPVQVRRVPCSAVFGVPWARKKGV